MSRAIRSRCRRGSATCRSASASTRTSACTRIWTSTPTCRACRKAARQKRYAELLHMTGLGPFTARLAGRLSGGMKQKLGLACTLVQSARTAAARRADRRRRSGVAARAVADHRAPDPRSPHDGSVQHRLSRRGGALRRGAADPRGPVARQRPAGRFHRRDGGTQLLRHRQAWTASAAGASCGSARA